MPKRPRPMHVVNRGSSQGSGKQARDPSCTPQVSLWRCRVSCRAICSCRTCSVRVRHDSRGLERLEQAETDDTSHVRDRWGQNHACNVLQHGHDNGGRSLQMSSVNFSTLASTFAILVFHVSSALPHCLMLVSVGPGDEHCAALSFFFLIAVSNCSTAFPRSVDSFL